MRLPTVSATVLIVSTLLLIGFAVGRATSPQPRTIVVRSDIPGWIEIWTDGEIASEWQESDGDIYRWLDDALQLHPVRVPTVPPSGECPLL